VDRSSGIARHRYARSGPVENYIDLIEHGDGEGIGATLTYLADEYERERGRRPAPPD
jgi:hypothetical protein